MIPCLVALDCGNEIVFMALQYNDLGKAIDVNVLMDEVLGQDQFGHFH